MPANQQFTRSTNLPNGQRVTISIKHGGEASASIGGRLVNLGGLERIETPALAISPNLPTYGRMLIGDYWTERDTMYNPVSIHVALPDTGTEDLVTTKHRTRSLSEAGVEWIREMAAPLMWLYLEDRHRQGDEIHVRQGCAPPENMRITQPERAIYVDWPGTDPRMYTKTQLVITERAVAFPKTEKNANVIHCIHEAAGGSGLRVVAMPEHQTHPFARTNPPEGRVVGFRYRNMRGESHQVEPSARMPELVAEMTAVIEANRPENPLKR